MKEFNNRTIHELKILPRYFEDVVREIKQFEIRRNDRNFKVGDILFLREYERGKYTGRSCRVFVKYIYQGDGTFGLTSDFCILGIDGVHWVYLKYTGNNNTFYSSRFMKQD